MDGFVQPPEMQLPEVKGVGLTPGNPFAPLALGSLILLIVAVIGLFGLVIFGPDNSVRYTAATILLLVIILAPLPVTWLGIYSRNFVRIQRIIGGDYWAHWQLSPGENPHGDEVYIGPLGLYWPKRRWSLWGFGHGLVKVEKRWGELNFQYIIHRKKDDVNPLTRNLEENLRIPPECEEEADALVEKFQSRLGIPSGFRHDSRISDWITAGMVGGATIFCLTALLPLQGSSQRAQADMTAASAHANRATNEALLRDRLPTILRVIERRFQQLQAAGVGTYRPEELGFTSRDNILHVMTGYCASSGSFYVLIWEKEPTIEPFLGNVGVYHYVAGKWLPTCVPYPWSAKGSLKVNEDWHYVFLKPISEGDATETVKEWWKTRQASPPKP